MAELLLDVGQRLALLNQETRVGVPQVVQSNSWELRLLKNPIADPTPQIVAVNLFAVRGCEDPGGQRLPCLEGGSLPRRPKPFEGLGQHE